MRVSARNSLTPAQRDKYDRQLAFVLEHRSEVPKLANRVVKEISVSSATVYAVLSGNLFNSKVIATMYAIVAKHLGLSDLVGETPTSLGMNIANEQDRIILEKLISGKQQRNEIVLFIESFRLLAFQYESALIASKLLDEEISLNLRIRPRQYSPDTLTAIHEYLNIDAPSFPAAIDLIPETVSDRSAIISAAQAAIYSPPNDLSTFGKSTEPGDGEYFDKDRGVWCAADGTPLESTGRNKYPDE